MNLNLENLSLQVLHKKSPRNSSVFAFPLCSLHSDGAAFSSRTIPGERVLLPLDLKVSVVNASKGNVNI